MRFSWIILGLGIVGFSSIGCGDDGDVDDGGDGTGNTGTGNSGTGNTGNGGDGTGNTGTGGSGNEGTGGSGNEGNGGNGGSGGQGPEGPAETLRFIAFGDGGTGSGTQIQVADVVKTVCDAAGGCDFALYLGDNIYDTGVDSVNDSQFQTKFEIPYQNLTFPFYVTLGNHDFGGGGAGFEFMKGQYQVDYSGSGMSNKFTLPALYYAFDTQAQKAGVSFFSLNTNEVMYTGDDTQRLWLNGATSSSTNLWKIGFGHHTYISNGAHGNAGDYEWLPIQIPIVSGQNVKDFMDDSICGKVDVYFCGHDHNRQWLEPTCGTQFIVSGSAAKFTDFEHNAGDSGSNPTKFQQQDDTAGFFLVEILGNTFTATSYNELGQIEFSDSFTK